MQAEERMLSTQRNKMNLMQQAYVNHYQDNNIARYTHPPDQNFKPKKLTA